MSTGTFLHLLIGGAVALLGLITAAWLRFHLPLGETMALGHDTIGLLVFAAGLLVAYRGVKRHFDAADAARGG